MFCPDSPDLQLQSAVQAPADIGWRSTIYDNNAGPLAAISLPHESNGPIWNVATDLVIPPSGRIKLSAQMPLVRKSVGNSFEYVHASIVFENAFMNALHRASAVRNALRIGAVGDVQRRMRLDSQYVQALCPIVSPCPVVPFYTI